MTIEMFWVGLILVSIVFEVITVGLTAIWISGGALVALIVAWLGGSLNMQLILFFATTFALLFWTRPFAVKFVNTKRTKTNVEETIGQQVRVLERVSNREETGKVRYKGMEWTARSAKADEEFEVDETAIVQAIEGVKMIIGRPNA